MLPEGIDNRRCVKSARSEQGMSRVQLALNVDDIESSVAFYTKVFGVEPAKRRPGYANFAIADPALKLVLIENPGSGGTLNHLGVEVTSATEVVEATQRFAAAGLSTQLEEGTTCCYALQDKVWVDEAGSGAWEFYAVLGDAGADLEGTMQIEPQLSGSSACCGAEQEAAGGCCS
jgi:catechol 2,3-dioxygenase-like lactoylglutathione lyase family enzyme